MEIKNSNKAFGILLFILCVGMLQNASAATIVSVVAPQNVDKGQTFTINITIQPDTAIAGVQFDLRFNSTLLTVNSVTEGDLLKQGGASTYFSVQKINNTAGNIIGVAGAITSSGQTVSSAGTFAIISVTSKNVDGKSFLNLSNVIVGDISANPVAITVNNGSVNVRMIAGCDPCLSPSLIKGKVAYSDGTLISGAVVSVFVDGIYREDITTNSLGINVSSAAICTNGSFIELRTTVGGTTYNKSGILNCGGQLELNITVTKCSDGTAYNQCSATKPKYCSSGNLIDNCNQCSCPSGQSCNATNGACYNACSDGTPYGQCSSNKPKYCSSGNLIDNCSKCSCPSGQNCSAGSCAVIQTANVSVVAPQNVYKEQTFTINITIQPSAGIAGAQFDLRFNSTLLTVNSVTEGNLFNQGGASTYFSVQKINNTAGNIIGVAGAITTSGQTVSSAGTFAIISVTSKNVDGTSFLNLSNVIVGDINASPLAIILNNGFVGVGITGGCTTSSSCAGNQFCNSSNLCQNLSCVSPNGAAFNHTCVNCTSNSNCPSGQSCNLVSHQCQAGVYCTADSNCSVWENCLNNTCTAIATYCNATIPCASGYSCNSSSRCQNISGYCSSSSNCNVSKGEFCNGINRCALNTTLNSTNCTSNSNCFSGFYCNSTAHECRQILSYCTSNSNCSFGSFCNSSNLCQQQSGCVSNSTCSFGYFCNTSAGLLSCQLISGYCVNDSNCASGVQCNTTSHTCLSKKANGDYCSSSSECSSGICISGRCFDSSWECMFDSDCYYTKGSGYYCSVNKCYPAYGGGGGGGGTISGGAIGGISSGVFVKNMSFSVGDVFSGKSSQIRVVDADGNPVPVAVVTLTFSNGTKKTVTTDSNGNFDFFVDSYGKVKVTIMKGYSTFEKEIDVKKGKLEISTSVAGSMKAGKEFSLSVKDSVSGNFVDAAFSVLNEKGDKIYDSTSGASGAGSTIKISSEGKYTIEVKKDGYDTIKKEIYVEALKNLKIVAPQKIEYGKEQTFQVTDSDGKPVKSSVSVTFPDGTSKTYETGSDGKVSFTIYSVGKLKMAASSEDYISASSEAYSIGHIKIIVPGKIVVGEEFELKIVDDAGNLVNGVSVSVATAKGKESYILNGKQKIKIPEESALITAEKEGYVGASLNVSLERGFNFVQILILLILLLVLAVVLFLAYKYRQYKKEMEEEEARKEVEESLKSIKDKNSLMGMGTGRSLEEYQRKL